MRNIETIVLLALVLVAPGAIVNGAINESTPRQVARSGAATLVVIPARRPITVALSPPPPLPPAAEQVRALTLHALLRRQVGTRVDTVRQAISRTAERIHVASNDGREWLFVRNVRDTRRVAGMLIDHLTRSIVFHDESDLRNMLGLRGWAQALALGFDAELLDSLQPTGRTKSIGTLRAVRYANPRKDAELSEVWWNGRDFLATGFTSTTAEGSVRFSVERIRPGVDESLFRAPTERFPSYRALDLAEWLERH